MDTKKLLIKYIINTCLMFIVVAALLVQPLSKTRIASAQPVEIVSEYLILVDNSGSMAEGSPQKYKQVNEIFKNFVDSLEPGVHLKIYSFNNNIVPVGDWPNITDGDKSGIKSQIDAIPLPAGSTRLWDAVCMGLDELKTWGGDGRTHLQTLMSYTDGEDTASTKKVNDCVDIYEDLHKNGYTYWIYNAIGGATIPSDLGPDVIPAQSEVPQPIRIVHIRPLALDLGNLYITSGKADPNTSCLLTWASDPSSLGLKVQLYKPESGSRPLPTNQEMQVCRSGSDCEREIEVSTKKNCLDLSLINFNQAKLSTGDEGTYELLLQVKIISPNPNEQTFIFPEKILLRFSINLPPPTPTDTPTLPPTDTPTITPTGVPTNTPTPTVTLTPPTPPTATYTPKPTPTPTQRPGEIVFDLQGDKIIDLGLLPKPIGDQPSTARQAVTIQWKTTEIQPALKVELTWDDQDNTQAELAEYINLELDQPGKSILLTPANKEFQVAVALPLEGYNSLGSGTTTFKGELRFTPQNATISGGGEQTEREWVVPVQYSVYKPGPIWPYFLILGVLIVVFLFITRPRFPRDAQVKVDGLESYLSSTPSANWWSGAINLGSDSASIPLTDEDIDCLRLVPSWHGSILGNLLGQRSAANCTLKVLNGTAQLENGEEILTNSTRAISYPTHLTMSGTKTAHDLTISRITFDQPFDESLPMEG